MKPLSATMKSHCNASASAYGAEALFFSVSGQEVHGNDSVVEAGLVGLCRRTWLRNPGCAASTANLCGKDAYFLQRETLRALSGATQSEPYHQQEQTKPS
jgi:hypothetical protein